MTLLKLKWGGVFALGLMVSSAGAADNNSIQMPPAPPGFKYQEVTPKVRLHELSPVEYFRTLLGMTPAQRQGLLANKSPEDRSAILAKVREYEAMPADIREARLRQTELLWEIATLMRLPPAGRTGRLKDFRGRTAFWWMTICGGGTGCPRTCRRHFWKRRRSSVITCASKASSAEEQRRIIDRLPPAQRADWARELQHWQELSEGQRQELCDRFRQLFEVENVRKQQVTNGFTDAERQQMENALKTFAQLSPDQRKICINSFSKFAVMTPQQRNEFLKNAERWQSMTSRERRLWRELVQQLPLLPPPPPGFDGDLPPLPPGMILATPPSPPGLGESAGVSAAPPVPLTATARK